MATSAGTRTASRTDRRITQAILTGAVSGAIAALVMAMFAMIASVAYQGHGFFTPLYHIASVFISPMTLMASMQAGMTGSAFYFSFGPAVLGAVIHMMVGAGYGAVFAVVVNMLKRSGPMLLALGLLWGALVFLFSAFVALPVMAAIFSSGDQITHMAQLAGWGTFFTEHLIFGLVLGALLMWRARSSSRVFASA